MRVNNPEVQDLFVHREKGHHAQKNQGRAHNHLKPVAVVVAVVKPEKT